MGSLASIIARPPTDPAKLTEKRIIQRDSLNPSHIRIIHKIRINIEEHWHIHGLASIQPLFLKAETLNLAEVWRNLSGTDTVCCYSYDVCVGIVRGGIEGEGGLAWQDTDFSLLRCEFPG